MEAKRHLSLLELQAGLVMRKATLFMDSNRSTEKAVKQRKDTALNSFEFRD
jgi:hypothetical protein